MKPHNGHMTNWRIWPALKEMGSTTKAEKAKIVAISQKQLRVEPLTPSLHTPPHQGRKEKEGREKVTR